MVAIKDLLGETMIRTDGRKVDELRPVRITRHFTDVPEGSVLVECGNTRVMCTATFTAGVPRWRKDSGLGWVTAEYAMLPRATADRTDRESVRGKIGGRTHEISRLIGRCLRGVVDMKALGENQVQIDCDVLQADGAGTRFRVGDAVTLSGFGDARNNGTYILRSIDGAKLIFDPNTFVGSGTVSGVTITRRIPDAQHAGSYGNRLWACAQDTVWCTKLGDPLSWFWYEADENGAVATAAWSVDVGAPGDFSGCAATGSGVVFLKPDGNELHPAIRS